MLVAMDKDKNRYIAENAEKIRDYFCRDCEEKVIIKKGNIKIHHFAHYPDSKCEYSIGESFEHEKSKETIAKILKDTGSQIELEYKPENINRRADVFVFDWNLAIEIQYSPISEEELNERTKDYKNSGYRVVWLFGREKHYDNRTETRLSRRGYTYKTYKPIRATKYLQKFFIYSYKFPDKIKGIILTKKIFTSYYFKEHNFPVHKIINFLILKEIEEEKARKSRIERMARMARMAKHENINCKNIYCDCQIIIP